MKRVLFFRTLIVILLMTSLIACISITPNNQINLNIPSSLFLADFVILAESAPPAIIKEEEEQQKNRQRRRTPGQDLQLLFPGMSRDSPISLDDLRF